MSFNKKNEDIYSDFEEVNNNQIPETKKKKIKKQLKIMNGQKPITK